MRLRKGIGNQEPRNRGGEGVRSNQRTKASTGPQDIGGGGGVQQQRTNGKKLAAFLFFFLAGTSPPGLPEAKGQEAAKP